MIRLKNLNKKRVLLRAPLLTVSGYGVHSRQIFDYLDSRADIDLTVQLVNWGITPWMVDSNLEAGLIGKIMQCSKEIKPPYDLTIQVQLPDEWDHKLGYKNIGVSAFVETTKCNPIWVDKCNLVDEVIVPSTFLNEMIENSGKTSTRITVVPEHFNRFLIKNSHNESLNLNLNSKFNFLLLGQLTGNNRENDRKNTANAIEWFCQAFEGNKNVGLIVKTNLGRCSYKDRKATIATIKSLIKSARKGTYPKIELIHGNLTSQEISCLYKNKDIKCLISATRGEGYGLPLVDAAAAGMPILVAPWSGHMEFLDKDKISCLDYELKEIHESRVDNRIFMKNAMWAEVADNDFKEKLISIYENYKNVKKKAQQLQQSVRSNYSRSAIFKRYDDVIGKYLI